ncbi:O-antigen polymerase [Flavobacterium sp. PL12]|uniref:O-antigen polymerase n=1 Tax=Flavobacterium sp. PL12 TaxID=3071718 RepID=UPI00319E3460
MYFFSVSITFWIQEENIIYSIEATFFFLMVFMLYMIPILKFKPKYLNYIPRNQIKLFRVVSYFFIFFGIISYVYFLPIVYKLFSSGGSLMVLRTDMVGGANYVGEGFLPIILNFTCQFYPIILVFYFYSISYLNNKKIFNNLLLFSSTAYILNVLAAIGRDGFILWMMSYIFTFLLFYSFMTPVIKVKQKKVFIYIFVIALTFLVPITVARFYRGDVPDSGINSLKSYAGAQFANFNNFYNRIDKPEEIGSVNNLLPILNFFDGQSKGNQDFLSNWDNNVFKYGVDPNVFSTFIGSFFLQIGTIRTVGVSLFAFIIGSSLSRRCKRVDFSKLLLITIFSQIVLHGFFYFKLAYTVSFVYLISVIILAAFFKNKLNRK